MIWKGETNIFRAEKSRKNGEKNVRKERRWFEER